LLSSGRANACSSARGDSRGSRIGEREQLGEPFRLDELRGREEGGHVRGGERVP
jgi:hypothetical protein